MILQKQKPDTNDNSSIFIALHGFECESLFLQLCSKFSDSEAHKLININLLLMEFGSQSLSNWIFCAHEQSYATVCGSHLFCSEAVTPIYLTQWKNQISFGGGEVRIQTCSFQYRVFLELEKNSLEIYYSSLRGGFGSC